MQENLTGGFRTKNFHADDVFFLPATNRPARALYGAGKGIADND